MTSKEYKKVISFILNDLDTRDQLKLMTLIKEKVQENNLQTSKERN
jgi:RNA binding exosome subunit